MDSVLMRSNGCPNIYVQTLSFEYLCHIFSSAVELIYQRHFSAVSRTPTLVPGIVHILQFQRARLWSSVAYLFMHINFQSVPGLFRLRNWSGIKFRESKAKCKGIICVQTANSQPELKQTNYNTS